MLGAFCYVSLMQHRHKSPIPTQTVTETVWVGMVQVSFVFFPVTNQADHDRDTTVKLFLAFSIFINSPKAIFASEHEAAADH